MSGERWAVVGLVVIGLAGFITMVYGRGTTVNGAVPVPETVAV